MELPTIPMDPLYFWEDDKFPHNVSIFYVILEGTTKDDSLYVWKHVCKKFFRLWGFGGYAFARLYIKSALKTTLA